MIAKETLYRNPNYQRLSKPRREVAYLVLVEGTSFAAACKAKKLNQTRESRHKVLQLVLAGRTDLDLPREPEAANDPTQSIYDKADAMSASFDAFLKNNPTHPAAMAYKTASAAYNTASPTEGSCSICGAACNLFSAVAGGKRCCRECHTKASGDVLAAWREAFNGVLTAIRTA